MFRTLVSAGGLLALVLLMAGCDSGPTNRMAAARKAADEARAAAEEAAAHAKEAAEKGAAAAKESAEKAAAEAKEAAGKAAEAAKDAVATAKDAIAKKFDENLPKIQEKINGLSGDAKAKAQTQYDELKKTYEEAKASAPEKWEALKTKAMEQYEELKKMVGLDK
ncbi:MAG TPA: hypothetical protein VH120_09140 [Gemmataceae bacterium]|nr:hypothetical protein [Gemmataceae bacterium]